MMMSYAHCGALAKLIYFPQSCKIAATCSNFTGNTINGKRLFLPDQGINSFQITYFFVNHLLL